MGHDQAAYNDLSYLEALSRDYARGTPLFLQLLARFVSKQNRSCDGPGTDNLIPLVSRVAESSGGQRPAFFDHFWFPGPANFYRLRASSGLREEAKRTHLTCLFQPAAVLQTAQ
jgi:hypothetical protein